MIKAVLTGTACSGKSALLEELGKEGYKIVPEAETQIVNRLVRKWGDKKTREWILPNYSEFKQMVGINQAHLESQIVAGENEIVIYDRTALCWIAYCKLRDTPAPEILNQLSKNNDYQYVFLCEMLSSFDERRDEGRVMTKEEAFRLKGLIIDEYRSRKYNLIPVPENSLNEVDNLPYRVNFIKEILKINPASFRN